MDEVRSGACESDAPQAGRRRWGRFVVGILVLGLFLVLGRRYLGELRRLTDVSPSIVALMVASTVAARLVQGRSLQILLRAQGHRVGLGETFFLGIVTSYTNLVLPRAGTGAPALYLKRRYQVSFADFGSLLLLISVLHLVAAGSLGLVCLSVAHLEFRQPLDLKVTLAFAVVVLGGIVATFVRVPVAERRRGRIAEFLRRFAYSWAQLGSSRLIISQNLALQIVALVLQSLRLKLAFVAMGVEVSFLGVVVATMLGALAMLVSITPAGLGFREAAIAYSATMIGCSPSVAVAAAVLDRLVVTACVVILAQFGLWRLVRGAGNGSSGGGAAS